MSKSNLFSKPNYGEDEALLAKESRQQFKLSEKMWKPAQKIENKIRILPARGGSDASYHMKIGKHFVEHSDRTEGFICMRETYGKDCPACEAYFKIRKETTDKNLSKPYYPKLYGVFNILDRLEENPTVKLYEAPRTMVWKKIIFINKGSIKVIDEFDEDGKYIQEGRDVIILFAPKAEIHNMYVVYPGDKTPLGTEKEIEAWHADIIDLIPEQIALYAPIDYETAKIKSFGSVEEREELREKLQQKYEESQVKQKEKESSGVVVETPKEPVEEAEEDEVTKAKRILAEAEARAAKKLDKKKEEESEEEEEPEEEDDIVVMEKKLAKARAKKAQDLAKKKKDHETIKDEEEKPKPKQTEKEKKKDKDAKNGTKNDAELAEKIADIKKQIQDKKKK